jgi:hypothetical protein
LRDDRLLRITDARPLHILRPVTARGRLLGLVIAASVVVGCSSTHKSVGTLKDVVACATINLRFVPGFNVTQDWTQKVVRSGLAANNPAIRSAAAQFEAALSHADAAGEDTASLTMESACRVSHMGVQGVTAQDTSS